MNCNDQTLKGGGDCLVVEEGDRPYDVSATAWLVGQGVRYLNTADKEGELAYARVVELLRRCSEDVLETVIGLSQQAKSGDAPLRWSLLYILGDAGDSNAADFLVQTALRPLPESKQDEGCEGTRDMEMLVCTMAVHALQRVAERHPEVSKQLLKIVSEKPAKPILIEAVKVTDGLGLREEVQDLLSEEDRWILDIRQARTQELFVELEREDGQERVFTPPKGGAAYTAPHVACCTRKEK